MQYVHSFLQNQNKKIEEQINRVRKQDKKQVTVVNETTAAISKVLFFQQNDSNQALCILISLVFFSPPFLLLCPLFNILPLLPPPRSSHLLRL